MPAHVALDDALVLDAKKLGKHKTNKDAVTAALDEYVRRRRQLRIFDLVRKVDYDVKHDYKRLRRRKLR